MIKSHPPSAGITIKYPGGMVLIEKQQVQPQNPEENEIKTMSPLRGLKFVGGMIYSNSIPPGFLKVF